MTTGDIATSDQRDASAFDERALRSRAVWRACVCPGAGFALVGSSPLAVATFVSSLCILPLAAWVAFQPNALSVWAAIAVVVVASILCVAEQIGIKMMDVRPPGPTVLARGFVASSCIMWFAVAAALGLLFTAFGSLRMAGSGMLPTLEDRERLVYHKHVDWNRVKPGALIVYRNPDNSAWGRAGWIVISRILAGPGDRISIANGKYLVNGNAGSDVAETGRYAPVIDVPSAPESLTVPSDCFFIVQDNPSGGFDSRVLSWIPKNRVIGSRLWYRSSRGVFRAIE